MLKLPESCWLITIMTWISYFTRRTSCMISWPQEDSKIFQSLKIFSRRESPASTQVVRWLSTRRSWEETNTLFRLCLSMEHQIHMQRTLMVWPQSMLLAPSSTGRLLKTWWRSEVILFSQTTTATLSSICSVRVVSRTSSMTSQRCLYRRLTSDSQETTYARPHWTF